MMDSRSFFLSLLITTAGLGMIPLVEGYVAGAPPESCDTMLPIHTGNGFDDCSVADLCPTVSIEGVETIDNTFQYNCSQNYTITMSGGTSSLRGFLVEFRNFSDSSTFDGNLSHVGEFFIRSGYEDSTRLECDGHGVTQSKINTHGITSFIWLSPGIGRQEKFQMWYTIVTSPSAFFRPRKGIVGIPSEMSCTCTNDSSIYVTQTTPHYHAICLRCPENGTIENTADGITCTCPENTYFVMNQVGSTYLSECLECPANSMSEKGFSEICPCEEGFSRIKLNASLPCEECFTTSPTNITVISPQRPKIGITWEAPANTERWSVLYRVTVSDGTSNVTHVTESTVAMTALDNLILQSNYTLYVTTFTETGCETGPDSVDITVMERCPDTPPNITNVVVSAESVQLEYTPPYTEDPLIEESDFRYAVYLKCGFDSEFILVEDGIQDRTFTILGLQEVTVCTAMLVAYSKDCSLVLGGRFSAVSECFTTPPTNITVISSQRPEIEITWEAPANSERWSFLYRVTAVSDRTGNVIAADSSNETTATIWNLTLFTSYSLHVTAYTEKGCVTGHGSVDITVMERCPDTPPNITNVVVTAESVQLEYTPPYTEDPLIEESDFRYAVYLKCGSDFNSSLIENGIRNTTYIISDLQEVTECTVTLVAYSNDCPIIFRDQFSVSTTFTTEALECFTTPPTNITVISSQRPDIEITWEAPANSERWSVLYRVRVGDRTGDVIVVDGSNETTATIRNLTLFTSYSLHVTAYTETGCVTGPTSVGITVMERCPDTPPNITNVVVSAESVQLEYTPPYTEDPLIEESDFRYAVYLECSFDSNSSLVEDGIQNTTYVISDLQEVTECTATVIAYSNDCPIIFRDQYSASTTFTTEALECFTTPPTNITVISSQRPEIEITWEAPANTERRTVLYRVTVSDGTSNVTEVDSIDVTVATIPNLDVLTNYTLYVTAFTETGCETGPTSVYITVMERCPDTPPNITNVVASAESVQLEYIPPYTEDPLIEEFDFRYAVYLRCSSDSNFILVEDRIQDTTYNISGLREVTECTAMLVAYSIDCPLVLGGRFSDSIFFTTGLLECFTTPPTGLTVITSQRPEIEITWEAPANSERWSVLYRVTVSDSRSDVTVVNGSNKTTATIRNLTLFTSYSLYVTAFTETGCETGPDSVGITVMERCPDTPPNITNVVVSAESVQLEYTPPYTEDPLIEESDFCYAVYLECSFDSNSSLVEDGIRNTMYIISDLQEMTECTATVVAYSNDCPIIFRDQFSVSTTFTTEALECFTTPPTNITVISSQRPDIEITWEAPANTERRTVLYRVTVSDGTSNVTAVNSIDVTVAVLPNLDVLTNYTLYVTAFTTTGCETGPDSVDITVMERCPDTPPNITNVVVSAESAQLEYTPPYTEDPLIEESDFRYAVYRKCGSDSDFILVEDGISDTTYIISGLPEVTECSAILVAYSNDCRLMLGGQFSTNTSFTTTSSVPANCTVFSKLTTLSTGSKKAIIDGISTTIQDMFGDGSSFFTLFDRNLLLFDVGILNARRLLPFGSQYGDSVFEFSYIDYYRYIYGVQYTLSRPLPFFGSDQSDLYVNFFGFVSIGQPYTNPWRRTIFPLTGTVPMVASFWWSYTSTIYIHEYSRGGGSAYEDAVISMVESRLHQYPQVNTTFRPEVILSVTWSLNLAYIRYTTQMLIVSNGIRTFSLVSYDEDNWFFAYWYSRYRFNDPVIGYSAGDGINFENLNVEFWELNVTMGNTGSPGVWIFPLFDTQDDQSAEEDCKAWYDSERLEGPVDYANRSILNSCPCTIEQAQANRRAGWRWGFRYGSRENCTVLWWPRRTGWRWWGREPVGTVECCYDEFGSLLVGPRSGGTSKKYHFYYEAAQHINLDLIPYQDCCVRSSKTELCNYYYELRKSDDCSSYDEALAQNWGDPHFDSFDGLGYTFNGKGEFWLVQTTDSSISIQVRLTPTVNGTATFISAAAIQFDGGVPANAYIENNAVVVEISGQMFTRENIENTTYVGSNGTVYDLDLMAGSNAINQLQNVSLILDQDDPGISISNVMGSLSVTVSLQAEGALSVSSDLSGNAFQDNTRGLLGVINGDTANDFTLPNGTLVDVNSTEEEIYYNFGLAWRVSESESIFVYRGSDTYTNVNDDTDFTPQFGVDLGSIPEDVRESCGSNTQCLFDYQQTGNLELAMSTASEQERLNSVRTVLNTVPPSITGPRTIRVIAGQRFTAMYNSTGNMTLQFPTPQNLTLIDGVLLWNVPPSLVPEEAIRIMSTVPDGNATSTITVSVVLCGCGEGGECIQVDMPNFGNGSYYQEQCRCAPAYEGKLCENDIDGCNENPCQDPSLCEDVPAPGVGFNCTGCLEGYQLSRNMCDDIDECSDTNACSGPSMCVNSDGSFQCVCNMGYMIQGTECIDIDECSEGSANCDQMCVNNDGGFECRCQTGFNEDPDSGNCIAIRSCELDCGAGECVTMEGADVCVCPSGMSSKEQSCADCQNDTFGFNCSMICNCMNGGTCNNVRGCVCVSGWTGGNCSIVVNDFNPTFDANLQSMVAILDRDPVDKIVITLRATDRDINSLASLVTYSTEDFTPQSSSMYEDGRPFFSLNSSNGEVRIQRQPEGDGPYLLTVLARDSAPIPRTSTPFLFVITVTSTFEEVLTLTVLENATNGTMVGRLQCSGLGVGQFVSVEEDIGNALEVFQLAVDGFVTVKSALDYESIERYVFSINCTEGATTRFASVRLSVTDVNDNSPNITGYSGLSLIVSENNNVGEILGNVSVSDEDSEENGRISFRVDPPNTPVSVNDNGEIVMTAVVNYENINMYSFTVTAVDGGNPSQSSTPLFYTLTVQDVNDPPRFGGTAYVTILPGYAEIAPSPLLNISVSDDDSGAYDWVNVSVDIPWLKVNVSRASQQVLLKQYPGDSLEVGSADYLQHSDISPYLDGDQTPNTQQSGQAVYLRGMLTTRDGGNLETSVPIFIVIFPTSALVQVTIATNRTVEGFRPQAITMAMVFEQSLIQRTIPFQGRPVYLFNMYSIEQPSNEDNSIRLYGFFHNSTLVSGPIDVVMLPQNYHFLTESIVKDVLAEEYTRSEVARALGTSVEYSVEGTNVTATPQPTDEPATLSVGVTVTVVISTFVATVVLTAGIGIVILLLIKAKKVGKKPVGTDASLANQPDALVMENYT